MSNWSCLIILCVLCDCRSVQHLCFKNCLGALRGWKHSPATAVLLWDPQPPCCALDRIKRHVLRGLGCAIVTSTWQLKTVCESSLLWTSRLMALPDVYGPRQFWNFGLQSDLQNAMTVLHVTHKIVIRDVHQDWHVYEHTKDVAPGVIANSKLSSSLGHGAREKRAWIYSWTPCCWHESSRLIDVILIFDKRKLCKNHQSCEHLDWWRCHDMRLAISEN